MWLRCFIHFSCFFISIFFKSLIYIEKNMSATKKNVIPNAIPNAIQKKGNNTSVSKGYNIANRKEIQNQLDNDTQSNILGITPFAVQKIKEDKHTLRAKYLQDQQRLQEGREQLKLLKQNQQAAIVSTPQTLPPDVLSALYKSITTDHGYGAKGDITAFFPYFVPYMVNPPQNCLPGVSRSLKITVDIGLHSYLIVRKGRDIATGNVINLYLDECALPANLNVITGNTMNAALLEENTLNFKHYLLTGPSRTPDEIATYLNELQPTIARELKTRIEGNIKRARATGKLVNQAFPEWARTYEGELEEIDRLLRCHIMHISSTPHYLSVANRTLHNRFCSIDHDDWNFRVKHHEVLDKQPPEGCSKLAAAEAEKLAFTIIVRVDLCYGGQNYAFSLRLDRALLQDALPHNTSYIFKYSEMIEAFQSPEFREHLLKILSESPSASTAELQSLWPSATFQIIETGCASIAKCIEETDRRVKTLRLKCYDALTHQDQLCNGIYLMGLPCINPNFRQLFFPGHRDDNIITQVRFCLRFQNNHQDWVQTINTFDSERSDDILRVRSGQICPSMSSSSGDTGTSQDTLTTITFSEIVKTDVSKPEVQQFLNPAIIKKEVEEIKEGFTKLSEEVTSLNANSTTLYKDGPPPTEPVRTIKQAVVNPGIFSKIYSGISGLASALSSWLPMLGGASSCNLVTKTKRKSVRSRSHVSRLSQRGGRGRGRGGRGGGRGSKTRRRSLRRSNKKLK